MLKRFPRLRGIRLLLGISLLWLPLSMLFDGLNTLILPRQLSGLVRSGSEASVLGLLSQFGPEGALYVVDFGIIHIAPEKGGICQQIGTGSLWRIHRTEGPQGVLPSKPITVPLYLLQGLAILVGVVGTIGEYSCWARDCLGAMVARNDAVIASDLHQAKNQAQVLRILQN